VKAAFLTDLGRVEIRETPAPKLQRDDDVLLRIDAVGICGSDMHYYKAGGIGSQKIRYPWTIGHECTGSVLEIGDKVTALKRGQRVAVDPLIVCGQCDQCLAGRYHTCRNQRFLGSPGQAPGALAEYLLMPAACCYPLPDSLTDAQGVVIEPLSIGVYAQRFAGQTKGTNLAVLGTGPIGLCVLLALQAAGGCESYATDLIDERLEVARKCGAKWTGNSDRQDIVAEMLKRRPDGLDYVFECAGEQETLDQGVELLAPGGTLLLVGIPETQRVSFNIDLLRRKELRLQNVRRQNDCVAESIRLVTSGAINVDPLITHHFTLAETKAAFDLVADYRDGVLKAIIHVSGEA